jgi:glycosyltransferase involved in cell wall biosynthesis
MKVLMQIRADAERIGGGDVQQMRETAGVLQKLGLEVEMSTRIPADPRGFDLVHLFNTTRINETWQHFLAARRAGVPVAVSTIWHSMKEMRRYYAMQYRVPWFPVWQYSALREAFYARRSGCRLDAGSVFRYRGCQRAVASGADVLLPNSDAERRILEEELGVEPRLVRVIPNGFNVGMARAAAGGAGVRSGVICAGRIEPRKNSCGVIRTFRRLGMKGRSLKFYGGINESHGGYASEFRSGLEPDWIEYGGRVEPGELYGAFAGAEVVVLTSFYETTGLAALEGLACGARVVVSDSPYTREYFRDAAFYCDPYDDESMMRALSEALAAPPPQVPEWISDYTWDQAGRLTLAAYQAVLAKVKG